jgi:hypothetical protein
MLQNTLVLLCILLYRKMADALSAERLAYAFYKSYISQYVTGIVE